MTNASPTPTPPAGPTPPLLTVLLVSYNTKHLLSQCLDAVEAACAAIASCEIVVVDNASRDGSAEYLEQHYPDIRLIRSGANLGFGRANNLALPSIASPYLLLLNTDAFVRADSIATAMDYMAGHPDCGILGTLLIGRDGAHQPSCRFFPTPWNVFLTRMGLARFFPRTQLIDDPRWDWRETRECDWVPGCFYLVRKAAIDQAGLFDPRYFLYYEEVDHCAATKNAGWKVVYHPCTEVVHLGGESVAADGEISRSGRQSEVLEIESAYLYFRKTGGLGASLAHLSLGLFADGLLALRRLAGRGSGSSAGYHAQRMRRLLSAFFATRGGARAVR